MFKKLAEAEFVIFRELCLSRLPVDGGWLVLWLPWMLGFGPGAPRVATPQDSEPGVAWPC